MQKDLIVAIFAATSAGDDADGCFGTGYPVTDDLILTSRHVVEPENPNSSVQIEVKWFYDQPAGGESPAWAKADVVWTGPADLDAALIRCRRPEHLRKFPVGQLVERRPVDGERWQSAGFARANKRNDVREPGQFGGTLRTMAEAAAFFEVIEDAKPIAEDQWKGVSGMPVFADFKILGIVKHVPPNYDHQKLEAVPMWRLLQDEDFSKALGLDEKRERLEAIRKWLRNLLERSEKATLGFATALGLSSNDVRERREFVVDELLNNTPPLERLFELALSVQMELRNLRDQTGARVAAELVLTILPAIHDTAVVTDVRRRKGDVSKWIIALPTKLPTLAEIIMAGADRRAASVQPPASPYQFPSGEYSLSEPPESGRDADGKQFSTDWSHDLLHTFSDDLGQFKETFQKYLKERFVQSSLRSLEAGHSEEELLKTVAKRLHRLAEVKEGGLTYYYIVRMPKNQEAWQKREAVLAELKKTFPDIAFLRLAGTEDLDVECDRYSQLCDLLYKARLESNP